MSDKPKAQRVGADLDDATLILKLRWPLDGKRAGMFATYALQFPESVPSWEPPFIALRNTPTA